MLISLCSERVSVRETVGRFLVSKQHKIKKKHKSTTPNLQTFIYLPELCSYPPYRPSVSFYAQNACVCYYEKDLHNIKQVYTVVLMAVETKNSMEVFRKRREIFLLGQQIVFLYKTRGLQWVC